VDPARHSHPQPPPWRDPRDRQDEADDAEKKPTRFYVEAGVWVALPAGVEFQPAVEFDPNDPFDVQILSPRPDTDPGERYRAGFHLPGDRGSLVGTWFSHDVEQSPALRAASDFRYGETLVHPGFAGFDNDGLADAFDFTGDVSLRDFRIDYARTAFRNDRITGRWFVGFRRVHHHRRQEASYSALAPLNLPVPIAEYPQLLPQPDTALIESRFSGRGLEAGLDLELPMLPKYGLSLEGGFAIAVLRGDIDAQFRSTTWVYVEPDGTLFLPPYDWDRPIDPNAPEPVPIAAVLQQLPFGAGLHEESRSTSADVTEAYLGIRWNAWRGLDVLAGFRIARYADVGLDLRVQNVDSLGNLNFVDVIEIDRSVTYEGFYGSLAWRF